MTILSASLKEEFEMPGSGVATWQFRDDGPQATPPLGPLSARLLQAGFLSSRDGVRWSEKGRGIDETQRKRQSQRDRVRKETGRSIHSVPS